MHHLATEDVLRAWLDRLSEDNATPSEARRRFAQDRFETTSWTSYTNRCQDFPAEDSGLCTIFAASARASDHQPSDEGTDRDFKHQDADHARRWIIRTIYVEGVATGSCSRRVACRWT